MTKHFNKPAGLLNHLDYLFVLRPMLFFPGWSTLLAGALIQSKSNLFLSADKILHLNYPLIIPVLAVFGLAMGMSFLLNQLQDINTDRKNNKLFIISEGHISKTSVKIEIVILGVIAVGGGFLLSMATGWLIIIFILITGYFYNFKPFNLKDHPIGSLVANSSMGWLAFAIGWSLVKPFSVDIIIDSIPYLFFNTALYLFTTLPDIDGDQEVSKRTLAVIFGLTWIIYFAFMLYLISLTASILLRDWQAAFFIVLSFPFFIWTLVKKDKSSTIKATKYSILLFAVMICLKIPFYLILMVVIFFLTRWYFKWRFNFDYPNFKGT